MVRDNVPHTRNQKIDTHSDRMFFLQFKKCNSYGNISHVYIENIITTFIQSSPLLIQLSNSANFMSICVVLCSLIEYELNDGKHTSFRASLGGHSCLNTRQPVRPRTFHQVHFLIDFHFNFAIIFVQKLMQKI